MQEKWFIKCICHNQQSEVSNEFKEYVKNEPLKPVRDSLDSAGNVENTVALVMFLSLIKKKKRSMFI